MQIHIRLLEKDKNRLVVLAEAKGLTANMMAKVLLVEKIRRAKRK